MQEHRKLKRYTISGRPTIMLRGNWLEECGFSEDMPIEVICEKGKLTIIPRDPDPIPEPVQKGQRSHPVSDSQSEMDSGEVSPKKQQITENVK